MRIVSLGSLALATVVTLTASAAEAGHRYRCRTCSSSAQRSGTWHHFSSGGGMYVPRATQVASVEPAAAWGAPSGHYSGPGPVMWATPVRSTHQCGRCGAR